MSRDRWKIVSYARKRIKRVLLYIVYNSKMCSYVRFPSDKNMMILRIRNKILYWIFLVIYWMTINWNFITAFLCIERWEVYFQTVDPLPPPLFISTIIRLLYYNAVKILFLRDNIKKNLFHDVHTWSVILSGPPPLYEKFLNMPLEGSIDVPVRSNGGGQASCGMYL